MKMFDAVYGPMWPGASLVLSLLLILSIGCEIPEIEIDEDRPAPTAEQATRDLSTQAETPTAIEPEKPREFTAKDPKRGKKSRAVGGYSGAVFGARFSAEHRMIINQIEQAKNLYKAEQGNYPKTEKDFWENIIKANQIQLPEWEEGEEYFYDPTDHELKIRPKPNP